MSAILRRLGFVSLLLVLFSHPVLATTIVVDETTCTLVDAITAANTDTAVGGCVAGSGADTIKLTTDVTLTEVNNEPGPWNANGLPIVESDITVEGGGFTIERDADAPPFRLFHVNATLSLNNVVLTNGFPGSDPFYGECVELGGGIANQGILTLTDTTVSACSCGGIYNGNSGTAILTNTVISQNGQSGMFNQGTLELTNSSVSGNSAGRGGGIWNENLGTVTLTNSTVSDNSSHAFTDARGGGIASDNGVVDLTNSTVSGNSATAISGTPVVFGGGIFGSGGAVFTLTNSMVSGNSAWTAGGGIYGDSGSTISLANSIVANNESGNGENCCTLWDCSGGVTDNGNNFADNDTCGVGFADITPDVDFDTELADNGGPTQTHALFPGSVAIDAAGDCGLDTDQRGFPRDDGACDSGSFEFQGGEGDGGGVPASTGIGMLLMVLVLLGTSAYLVRRRATS